MCGNDPLITPPGMRAAGCALPARPAPGAFNPLSRR